MVLAKATDFLTADEVRRLRAKSDLRGAWLLVHCWGVVAMAMALYALWPNPLTLFVGVLLVGGRQLGLAVLMHEAAHGTLFATRRINERAGQWLAAWPVGSDMQLYRRYHMDHHRFTQSEADPDLSLSRPFPVSRASLARKMLRDLAGWTFLRTRAAQVRLALGPKDRPLPARIARAFHAFRGILLANALLFAALAAAGHWQLYLLLWLLPLATVFQLVIRVRNIAEHAVVPDDADPLRNTRTTCASWAERVLLAPYWVNYHLEHHLFPWVPAYRLPEAHRLLADKGLLPRMETRRSYAEVLARATAG